MYRQDSARYLRYLHSQEMGPTSGWYYDALNFLAIGIREGRSNRKKIMKAILAIKDYEGVLGTYSSASNDDGLHKVSVVCIKNGWHELIK